MAETILAVVAFASLACGALSVPYLRRKDRLKSRLKSRVARRLKEARSMRVEVIYQLGWLELFDLQLVGTDDNGAKRNYLFQSGNRRGRAILYMVPGDVRINPESPIPTEAVVVEGDERSRVLHAIGEADNKWDAGDPLAEFMVPVKS